MISICFFECTLQCLQYPLTFKYYRKDLAVTFCELCWVGRNLPRAMLCVKSASDSSISTLFSIIYEPSVKWCIKHLLLYNFDVARLACHLNHWVVHTLFYLIQTSMLPHCYNQDSDFNVLSFISDTTPKGVTGDARS